MKPISSVIDRRLVAAVVVAVGSLVAGALASRSSRAAEPVSKQDGIAAFETVKQVLQSPRCQNCHIPGDAPLVADDGRPHSQNVQRGPEGKGAAGFSCATCHAEANPPASYGAHMPPGAPDWRLPPPQHRMVFVGLSAGDLCRGLKDERANGGKNLDALVEHLHSGLVMWGWSPGTGRQPVSVPYDQFLAKFKTWTAAGAPCAQ
jgi:hypothetical protein